MLRSRDEGGQGPSVAGDVVYDEYQCVLFCAHAEQLGPQWYVCCEVEGVACRCCECRFEVGFADGRSSVSCGRAWSGGRMCCCGVPSVCGKVVRRLSCRVTTSVSANCSAGTFTDRQPQRYGDVVVAEGPLEVVEEPQAGLRGGQRQPVRPSVRYRVGCPRRLVQVLGEPGGGRVVEEDAPVSAVPSRARCVTRRGRPGWSRRRGRRSRGRRSPGTPRTAANASRASPSVSCGAAARRAARSRGRAGRPVELAVGGQRQASSDHDGAGTM